MRGGERNAVVSVIISLPRGIGEAGEAHGDGGIKALNFEDDFEAVIPRAYTKVGEESQMMEREGEVEG